MTPRQRVCGNCLPGFELRGGLCYAPRANCTGYDDNLLKCTSCANGFKLNPYGLCIFDSKDPYCLKRNPQSNICI